MTFRFGTRRINQQQLNAYIVSSMKMMKSMGFKAYDRVALYDSNTTEYALLMLCLWHMGAVACPINPRWPLGQAKEYANAIGAKFFLKREDIKKAVAFDARQQLYAPQQLPSFNPNQDAVIIATSGSNGAPKPALLTLGNLMASAQGSQAIIPFNSDDGWLLSLPLFHISGVSILMRAVNANATLIMAKDEDLIEGINCPAVTHVSLVATQLYRLLQQPSAILRLRQLKAILLGGSAISTALLEQSLKEQLPVYVSYGLTEMASQVATGRVVLAHQPCATVLPKRQLMINDEGEILVKGETLFKGYIAGSHVKNMVDNHGWFHTGDLGVLDAEGFLTVLGRRDNMFICAGENIYPEEIERVLANVPCVKQVMVVAKEDKEYGFKPIAFIDMDGAFDSRTLEKICREKLPAIKVPTAFLPWPSNKAAIKPSRKTLTALACTL